MRRQIFALAASMALLAGCDVMFVQRYPRRPATVVVAQPAYVVAQPAPPPAVVVAQPAPAPAPGMVAPPPPAAAPVAVAPVTVVVQPAPVVMEEGAVVNGVVVVVPANVDGYVLIGGEWYYWHSGFHCWVHAHRPYGWHPGGDIRVYHRWDEHPYYRH